MALAGVQTRFALPETSLGVIPAQIAPFVVQRIGLTQARRLALLGITVDAHEARALGLVHQVAEGDAELDTQLQQVLARVRRCAPDATARTKALLHRVGQEPMADLLDDAAALFAQAMRGPEGAEGHPGVHPEAPARVGRKRPLTHRLARVPPTSTEDADHAQKTPDRQPG